MKQRTLFTTVLAAFSLAVSIGAFLINGSKAEVKEVDAASHSANFDLYTYSGSYYSSISGTGKSLREQLTELIYPKGWYTYGGGGSDHLSTILQSADADPTNSANMIYFYTRDSVKKNAASTWNREHVWPQANSNNQWGTGSGAGSDLLHIRPTYNDTNNDRGNLKYGNVSGTDWKKYDGMIYGKKGTAFEPLDSVKGDSARICMYVWVAYYNRYGDSLPALTKVFESFDTMMEWHIADKPDVLEGNRNDFAQTSIQKNRNPFVDHPEYAWQIFGDKLSASVLAKAKEAYPGDGTTPIDGGDDPVTPDPNKRGTVNNPYTVAEALEVLNTSGPANDVYTRGTISKIDEVAPKVNNEGYGNATFSISDDGTETSPQLKAYRVKYLNETPFTAEDQIKVGDVVVMCGNLITYQDTPEYDNKSYVYSVNAEIPEDWPGGGGEGQGGEGGGEQPVPTSTLKEIKIVSLPTKLVYEGGEKFDKTGLKVNAIYGNKSVKDVTDKVTLSEPNMKKQGKPTVTVTYTEGSVTLTAGFFITINSDAKGGCGGSIIASSAIISLTSLLGASLLFYKKRKH